MLLPELSGLAFIASPDIPLHVLLQSWPPEATRQMSFYPKHSLMAQLVMRSCNQSSPLCFLWYQPMMPILALLPQFWSNNEKFQCIPDQILKLALCLTILLRKLNRIPQEFLHLFQPLFLASLSLASPLILLLVFIIITILYFLWHCFHLCLCL